jgi:SAM-dependent methyltransferase
MRGFSLARAAPPDYSNDCHDFSNDCHACRSTGVSRAFCSPSWTSSPPGLLYFAQKHVSGRSAAPIAQISPSWKFHERVIREHDVRSVLEFGAGKNLAQNVYLSRLGIRQTVVDLNPMADFDLINRAIKDVVALGVDIPDVTVSEIEDLQKNFSIEYIAPLDLADSGLPGGSFDACISTNTLEHVPIETIRRVLRELKRLLKPGGLISAQIDYSDHYAHTDRNITRVNFLRFSERDWAKYNHRNHYQNRLRHGHYTQLARDGGYRVIHDEPFAPAPAWPEEGRPELLFGDGNDRQLAGHHVWQAPG